MYYTSSILVGLFSVVTLVSPVLSAAVSPTQERDDNLPVAINEGAGGESDGNQRAVRGLPSNEDDSNDEDSGYSGLSLRSSPDIWKILRPMSPESKYGHYAATRWYFPGLGYFVRGGRAGESSNFIRFGRNSQHALISPFGPMYNSNTANKKNNFIRLGRENPRQNNFIRLGRSGTWDSNERFGVKVGFFPESYFSSYSSPVPMSVPSGPNYWSRATIGTTNGNSPSEDADADSYKLG